MFGLFRRKRTKPEVRDVLFGDRPLTSWPGESVDTDSEPWATFVRARECLETGQTNEAIELWREVLSMAGQESRHYLQAWRFLREAGIRPGLDVAKHLYGVVVEVALPDGLDIVAAYSDGTARYFNHSGAAVIWDAPDSSLRTQVDNVLRAGEVVVEQIGTWEGPRPPAPIRGQARINMLTPSGLHFGQAEISALSSDPMGGSVISTALELMQGLIAKAQG